MKKEGLLSIILPAFNEEKIIKKAANVIGSILNGASIPTKLFLWTMAQRMIHGIRLKQYQKKMSILLEFIFQKFWKGISAFCRTC